LEVEDGVLCGAGGVVCGGGGGIVSSLPSSHGMCGKARETGDGCNVAVVKRHAEDGEVV